MSPSLDWSSAAKPGSQRTAHPIPGTSGCISQSDPLKTGPRWWVYRKKGYGLFLQDFLYPGTKLGKNDRDCFPYQLVINPIFPPTHNEVGGTTPRSKYSCSCLSSISPTRSNLPGCSKHSMTSSLSNRPGKV